jgi:hypothetical protein
VRTDGLRLGSPSSKTLAAMAFFLRRGRRVAGAQDLICLFARLVWFMGS